MGNLLQDVRFGMRMLVKAPMLTLAAIACLGLGIGACTTIFSMINSVMIRPIPLDDAHDLYQVEGRLTTSPGAELSLSLSNFADLRERTATGDDRVFEELGIFDGNSFNIGRGSRSERVQGAVFSWNMFQVLRISPQVGRAFTRDEDRKGAERVVLLGHDLWQRRFDGDREIVGQRIPFDGREATVVGVMPEGFEFPLYSDVFVPFARDYEKEPRGSSWVKGLGRLAGGVTIEQAKARLTGVSAAMAKEFDLSRGNWRAGLAPLLEYYIPGNVQTILMLFPIAVLLVLIIACVNVANLLFAKGVERQRELAIRASLGATRGRIVRQLLTESTLLAFVGAGVGIFIAMWGLDALTAAVLIEIPYWIKMNIDVTVLVFTVVLAMLAGIVSGIMPALTASKADLTTDLKDAGTSATGSRARHRTRNTLMAVQITTAVALLISSGVMIESMIRTHTKDPGFDATNMLTARVVLPDAKYSGTPEIRAFTRRAVDEIRTIPGVRDVAVTNNLPVSGSTSSLSITIEGAPPPAPNEQWPWAFYKYVSANYFEVMGIRILEGRPFDERNATKPEAERVAIINENMAKRYWTGSPIGKRIRIGTQGQWVRIAAVVANVKYDSLDENPSRIIYFFSSQRASHAVSFAVRTERDPLSLASALRAKVQNMDADLPLYRMMTMLKVIQMEMWGSRFFAQIFASLAVLALVLASLGLYGVIAFNVSQRTHEIGIRMALGARARDVVGLVLRQGLVITAIGVLAGLLVSLGMTKLLTANVAEAQSRLTPFLLVPVVIVAIAMVACWLPARRATRIDPMNALRFE